MTPASARVVVVDVETTGYAASRGGRVIEIGAVAIENGCLTDEFSSLIDAGVLIAPAARQVHGISLGMLRGQPGPDQVWPAFAAFVGNALLVAHNAAFDRAFVGEETRLAGCALANPWGCTLRLARQRLPHLASHRLAAVAAELLGGWPENERAHRALGDARVTARIWLELQRLPELTGRRNRAHVR